MLGVGQIDVVRHRSILKKASAKVACVIIYSAVGPIGWQLIFIHDVVAEVFSDNCCYALLSK